MFNMKLKLRCLRPGRRRPPATPRHLPDQSGPNAPCQGHVFAKVVVDYPIRDIRSWKITNQCWRRGDLPKQTMQCRRTDHRSATDLNYHNAADTLTSTTLRHPTPFL